MIELQEKNLSFKDLLVKNLRWLMHKRKITEAELTRKTKIPSTTLHKILSGETADPRISTLQTLSTHFGVLLDHLYSKNMEVEEEASLIFPQKNFFIPIISWEDSVEIQDSTDFLSKFKNNEWITADILKTERAFALTTKPSMEPRLPRGTVLIIDICTAPIDGDLVIVHYANSKEATLRELFIDGPNKLLLPVNAITKGDNFDEKIHRIIGIVTQSRFSY